MNLNSENHEEPVRCRADEPTTEPQPSQRKSRHVEDSIERILDMLPRWINKGANIVSETKRLVFVTTILVLSLFPISKLLILEWREFELLSGWVATKPPSVQSGPEKSTASDQALEMHIKEPTNKPANDTPLVSNDSNRGLRLSSFARTNRSNHPFIARTASWKKPPAVSEVRSRRQSIPPFILPIGVPVTFRYENGQWRPRELQSLASIPSAWGNTPATRR